MRRVTFFLLCVSLCGWELAANATPVVAPDPPFTSERIDRLPSEIRRLVQSKCGAEAEAGHYFATYEHESNVIHLDYSRLQCPDASGGAATFGHLHQTFIKRNGRYVLSRTESELPRPHEQGF
ncbi:hypothetical protein [Bradyrhizobium sp. McL0616]|uniref:hypothetical protein n=1 Tax=Bradyrhizobium sp. McL0616 TaxID=3415674 RepID=UPI003CEB4725